MCPNVNICTYVNSYKVIWITVEMEDKEINDRVFKASLRIGKFVKT